MGVSSWPSARNRPVRRLVELVQSPFDRLKVGTHQHRPAGVADAIKPQRKFMHLSRKHLKYLEDGGRALAMFIRDVRRHDAYGKVGFEFRPTFQELRQLAGQSLRDSIGHSFDAANVAPPVCVHKHPKCLRWSFSILNGAEIISR